MSFTAHLPELRCSSAASCQNASDREASLCQRSSHSLKPPILQEQAKRDRARAAELDVWRLECEGIRERRETAQHAQARAEEDYANACTQQEAEAAEAAIAAAKAALGQALAEQEPPKPPPPLPDDDAKLFFTVRRGQWCCCHGKLMKGRVARCVRCNLANCFASGRSGAAFSFKGKGPVTGYRAIRALGHGQALYVALPCSKALQPLLPVFMRTMPSLASAELHGAPQQRGPLGSCRSSTSSCRFTAAWRRRICS